jgi:hypothetical protein
MYDEVAAFLRSSRVLEVLAQVEHERWAHWQGYLHSKCTHLDDGSLVIPPELADRWTAQIFTRYEDLTEKEKDSDREQADEYLKALRRLAAEG